MKLRMSLQIPNRLPGSETLVPVALVVFSVVVLALQGCHLGTRPIVAAPLPYEQLELAVLQVSPLGTPRAEVTKKLADAGIDGSFGVSDSVFYCDVWRREDGNRWYINVALLFDESGRVYKARPAQAATGVMLPSEATAVGGSSAGAANIGESRYSTAASGTAGHDDLSGTLELEPAATSTFRSGRRLPFASSDDR